MWKSVIRELRIHHWIKNLLVFAPLFFSGHGNIVGEMYLSLLALVTFSFTASSVYIINDIFDQDKDRLHPKKKHRPIASGALSIRNALIVLSVLLIFSMYLCFTFLPISYTLLLSLYFLLNVVYSLWLKHIVILDILIISAMYFMRVIGGALVIGVHVSPWIFLSTFFGAMFLISAKRYAELLAEHTEKRKVLDFYNEKILEVIFFVSITVTLVSYSLYVIDRFGKEGSYFYSIILVVYVLFRYSYNVFGRGQGEEPETILVKDIHILTTILLWVLFSLPYYYGPSILGMLRL